MNFFRNGVVWHGLVLLACLMLLSACADDDDADDPAGAADDDSDDDADDDLDDDDADDDTWPPLPDDDADDDEETPDDFIAQWPQSNIEDGDYDEAPSPGALREKADAYDRWHRDNHQPYHGAVVGVLFTGPDRTTVDRYYDWGDSSEWTGVYLVSQAMRYHVTGDPVAKENALRAAAALHGHLDVTDTDGFIARYRGAQEPSIYESDDWCDATDRCHHVETGPYAGDFWWGETSRDMYNGWFFGLGVAYDLIDDEPMRQTIRADVIEVLDTLMAQNWVILDEAGERTDAAPDVLPIFRMAWLTIGYHITGESRFADELRIWLRNARRSEIRFYSISFFNRYMEYYGNCLSHELWYNLLRLGKVYFSADDTAFLLDVFNNQSHAHVRLTHNPWFSGVYMGQGGYVPSTGDAYQTQLEQDLSDFPSAPHARYHLDERDPSTYQLDPFSVFLHDLQVQYPFLDDLIGGVDYQALEAFPIPQQCASDFIFQRSPFTIGACGEDNPAMVDPGVDYLISYWLAAYHGYLTKEM